MQLLTRLYCHSQVTTQSTLGSAVLANGDQRELHSAPFLGHSTLVSLGHSTLVSRLRLSAVSLFMIPWPQPVSRLLCAYLTTSKTTGTVKSFPVPLREEVVPCVCSYTLYPWVVHEHVKEVAFETKKRLYIDEATVCEQRLTELSLDFSWGQRFDDTDSVSGELREQSLPLKDWLGTSVDLQVATPL